MDNLLSNMDWGLYFPIIVTAIFQVVTLHPEAQPIYPSLETNMTLWIEYSGSDATWLPRLSHKRQYSLHLSLSEHWRLQPKHQAVRKPKLKRPHGEEDIPKKVPSQKLASTIRHTHHTHAPVFWLFCTQNNYYSSRQGSRHCEAETSCPTETCLNSWCTESQSIINGCFTPLSFGMICHNNFIGVNIMNEAIINLD